MNKTAKQSTKSGVSRGVAERSGKSRASGGLRRQYSAGMACVPGHSSLAAGGQLSGFNPMHPSALTGEGLKIEHRSVDGLIPYAKNARTHSDAQVAEIAASIRAFGWTNPILIDGENGIVAGHGRLLAARKLGLVSVPVIELAGMSDAQKRAYLLADNKLALNAGWDEEMLAAEVADLEAMGVDLTLAGFEEVEIEKLIDSLQKADAAMFPEEAP